MQSPKVIAGYFCSVTISAHAPLAPYKLPGCWPLHFESGIRHLPLCNHVEPFPRVMCADGTVRTEICRRGVSFVAPYCYNHLPRVLQCHDQASCIPTPNNRQFHCFRQSCWPAGCRCESGQVAAANPACMTGQFRGRRSPWIGVQTRKQERELCEDFDGRKNYLCCAPCRCMADALAPLLGCRVVAGYWHRVEKSRVPGAFSPMSMEMSL